MYFNALFSITLSPEFTFSDFEEAIPAMVTMQQLDSDHEEDSDIDIL